MIFLEDFSFVKIFLTKLSCHHDVTTTLNTSCSEYTMVLSARRGVSTCMYFLSNTNDFKNIFVVFGRFCFVV